MDFADAPEHAEFRREFRAWLDANLTDDLKVEDASDSRVAPDRETLEKRIAWQKKMYAAGWVGISWPKEYGGRGASFIQQVIFDEEYFRAHAPILPGHSALNLLGPTLIQLGTEAQKQRHLQPILAGDERWCQGFSEPGAGSERTGLRTRAVDNGRPFCRQRAEGVDLGRAFRRLVLPAGPHRSRRAEAPRHHLSARRHEDARHHRASAGPAQTATGISTRCSSRMWSFREENIVGKINEGWRVAITTLMFERGGAGGP